MQTTIPKTSLLFFTVVTILLASIATVAFAAPISVMADKTSYNSGEAVSVTGTATPDTWISIQLYNPNGMRMAISQVQSGSDGAYSVSKIYTFTTADVSGIWKVEAYDSSAVETAQKTFTVTAAPDTTNPTATISIVPSKGSYGLETITITVSADEPLSSCTIHVTQQGSARQTVSASASIGDPSKWGGSYTIMSGYDGTATIHIIAKDLAGNSGEASKSFAVFTGAVSPELEKRVGDLESQVADLESTIAGMSGLTSKVSSLESAQSSLESRISSLEGKINTLTNQVNSLSAKIDALPKAAPNMALVYGALIIGIVAIALSAVSMARKK